MIQGIVGLPGGGKTLFAVKRMIEERTRGRDVLSNCHSRRGVWRFALWDDMMQAENAYVTIDEAQLWFGSRKWAETKQSDLALWQQHRKNGLDLTWIAQHENRVDTVLRELTAYYWRVRAIGKRVHLARLFTPEEPKSVLRRRFFLASPALWGHYWTQEVIGLPDGRGYRFGGASAYATSGSIAGPQLGATYRLQPNQWRVMAPDGIRYASSVEDLRAAIVGAVAGWLMAGAPKSPEAIVTPLLMERADAVELPDWTAENASWLKEAWREGVTVGRCLLRGHSPEPPTVRAVSTRSRCEAGASVSEQVYTEPVRIGQPRPVRATNVNPRLVTRG